MDFPDSLKTGDSIAKQQDLLENVMKQLIRAHGFKILRRCRDKVGTYAFILKVNDISVFSNLTEAEAKLEKFKREHVSEEHEKQYGLEHSKIDGSTIFNVTLNGKGIVDSATGEPIKVGDLVAVTFWDGCFTHFYGKVQRDRDGLFIPTEGDIIGYLKDAHDIKKAKISKGHLLVCKTREHDGQTSCILVGYPILKDDSVEWETEVVPEPDRIDEADAEELERIAKELGCALY